MKKHNTLTIGSIISGTCRAEDIIPELLDCANELRLTRAERAQVRKIERRIDKAPEDYYTIEDADFDWDDLENIL